jgi:hypothetical protein
MWEPALLKNIVVNKKRKLSADGPRLYNQIEPSPEQLI